MDAHQSTELHQLEHATKVLEQRLKSAQRALPLTPALPTTFSQSDRNTQGNHTDNKPTEKPRYRHPPPGQTHR